MRHWPCGASCCYISFQLRVAAVHRLLHQYHGVWQHGGCNLFSICQGKRLIYLQTQPFFQSACSSLIIIARGYFEVRWPPGQETSLAPPMFETKFFGEQMYCIEESTWDIVGTFGRPPKVIPRPGHCAPLELPRYAPDNRVVIFVIKDKKFSVLIRSADHNFLFFC